eukprot:scaffold203125_cov42-Prasinocladus_malaysianus.AAC.1
MLEAVQKGANLSECFRKAQAAENHLENQSKGQNQARPIGPSVEVCNDALHQVTGNAITRSAYKLIRFNV